MNPCWICLLKSEIGVNLENEMGRVRPGMGARPTVVVPDPQLLCPTYRCRARPTC